LERWEIFVSGGHVVSRKQTPEREYHSDGRREDKENHEGRFSQQDVGYNQPFVKGLVGGARISAE